jgi:anti-sigma factor RsiW
MTTPNPTCDLVTERVALGEPLAELDAHATTCERCKRLVALPVELVATAHAADPGIGFASRVTAGAQHRIGVRRRRRVAVLGALSVAAATALMVSIASPGEPDTVAFPVPSLEQYKPALQPVAKHEHAKKHEVDPDVRALVHLANIDREIHISARWGRIEKPVRPYRAVLEGKLP